MARPGVTYLDVAKAAQELVAAGRTPTIEGIRIALGTGSNSTLGSHLKNWKSKQDQTQQIATKENIPEELVSALKGVWERVINQSDEKIQTIQQATQEELMQLQQELQRLQKDNVYCQQQSLQLKQERDGLFQEKLTIEQLLTNAKIDVATLTEKLSGFEQHNQEKQERIDELRRQNQQIQANLEHYRNASLEQRLADQQRYEDQQKQLEQTIHQMSQELVRIKEEKTFLQEKNQQLKLENKNLQLNFENVSLEQKSLNIRLADTFNELAKRTQDQQHWQEQFKVLQIKFENQCQSLTETKTQYAVLLQQFESMKIEINELRHQNKVIANEKWELGQEKAQLFGQLQQLSSLV